MAKRNHRSPPTVEVAAASSVSRRAGLAWMLAAGTILAAAVCAVYGRGVHAPFIFDDENSVTNNSSITRLWPLVGDADERGPLNPAPQYCTAGRPLVNLSLAVNYRFGGLDPTGYHVFNIIVHILSAWLLWAVVARTLALDCFAGRFARSGRPLALLVALIWAVHPLQTEAVQYVTQRTELMVSFFYLATLYGSLRYWAAEAGGRRIAWLVLATLACALGMACKEVMVSAPVMVLLFERTFIRKSFREALWFSWPLYCGLAAGWGLLALLNMRGPRTDTAGFHLGVPAYAWWFTQAKVLWMYLKLCVWPVPLVIHYEMPYLDTVTQAWPWLLATLLIVLLTLWLFWRRTAAGFVLVGLFAILSPTLVVPIISEVAAERRMYLPLAGLVALVVTGGYGLAQRMLASRESKRPAGPLGDPSLTATLVGGALVGTICGAASAGHVKLYQAPLLLWQDAYEHEPDSWIVRNNLALALRDAGRIAEAIPHFEAVVRLKPKSAHLRSRLAHAPLAIDRPQDAIPHLEEVVRLRPDESGSYDNLGFALIVLGRPQDALVTIERVLRTRARVARAAQ